MGEITPERTDRARRMSSAVRRWPAVLAVGCAGLMWGLELESAGRLLPVLSLIYLALAVLGRRSWSPDRSAATARRCRTARPLP